MIREMILWQTDFWRERSDMYVNGKIKLKKQFLVLFALLLLPVLCGCAAGHVKSDKEQVSDTADPVDAVPDEEEELVLPELESVSLAAVDTTQARAEELLARMSLYEKVCQLFMITPEALTGVASVTQAGDQTRVSLEADPVGGLIYFRENMLSGEQLRTMLEQTQSYSGIGLFLGVDEEGASVNRLMDTVGTTQVPAPYFYKDQGEGAARQNAFTIGTDAASFGFNVDFAPVADVWSNPANTVIGDRAYSDDFDEAALLVAAAVAGFHDAGMICSLKHFPGHGDTDTDSHTGSAFVYKTKEELLDQEWKTFSAGIEAGADLVMVGHITVPEIDAVPASVSKIMVTDLLRKELGFEGVIVTDSLQMGAVANVYASGDLAVRVLDAGADLILMPMDYRAARDGVLAAVEDGTLDVSRIDESVLRILKLKLQYHITE